MTALPDVVTIDTTIEIDAPVDAVWSVLTNFAAYRHWNPYLVRVQGRAEPGTIAMVDAVPAAGGALRYPVEVDDVEPPHRMRWLGGLADRTQFMGDHRWELTAVAESRTRLRQWELLSGALAPAIMGDGSSAAVDFQRFNEALKARAEAYGCHWAKEGRTRSR